MLVYSWVPRAEIMKPGRFVRITLESFYNCKADLKSGLESDLESDLASSSLAMVHQRGVAACDFPIEHVEKALVWTLQQPESTAAALFVNAFKLNPTQLEELLKIGDGGWKESSNASAEELEEIACLWLNHNTEDWGSWMKDVAHRSTALFEWEAWLIRCAFFSFLIFCAAGIAYSKQITRPITRQIETYFKTSTAEKPAAEPTTQTAKWRALLAKEKLAKEKLAKEKLVEKTPKEKTPKKKTHHALHLDQHVPPLLRIPCGKALQSKWRPVFIFLHEARLCLWYNHSGSTFQVVLFALGQIFVAASSGFIQVVLYERWLDNGLNRLSLEVTISCAVLMLTLKLIEWGVGLLPSCEKTVQKQLEERLWEVHHSMNETDLKSNLGETYKEEDKKSTLEDQFQQAIMSTASQLASDCYLSALKMFSSLLVVFFAVSYLFYLLHLFYYISYLFEQGNPGNLLSLKGAALNLAPA